jgi:dolichol-phosphate mannosyltransferase
VNRFKAYAEKLTWSYLLASLSTTGRTGNQFLRFALVGASGVLVNLAVYSGSLYLLGFYYLWAATLSFVTAMTSNFLLNLGWTFKTYHRGWSAVGLQYLRYTLVTVFSYGINILVLWFLVDYQHWHKILAQLAAIALTTGSNFLGSKLWAFRLKR